MDKEINKLLKNSNKFRLIENYLIKQNNKLKKFNYYVNNFQN